MNKPSLKGAAKVAKSKVCAKPVHKAFFRYALAAHLIHVGFTGLKLDSVEAAISFAAGVGTVLMHITDESEEDNEKRVRAIAEEIARKVKTEG